MATRSSPAVPACAVGFFAKTGRAIAVAVTGSPDEPSVSMRTEIALSSNERPETVEPFHAFLDVSWAEAVAGVGPAVSAIEELATESLRALLDGLAAGHRVVGIGVVGSKGQDPGRIGNSHIRAHAAEGQLFRRVLEVAAQRCGLPFESFSPAELPGAAALRLLRPAAKLEARVTALGRGVVRPWRREERSAALAAWMALARS